MNKSEVLELYKAFDAMCEIYFGVCIKTWKLTVYDTLQHNDITEHWNCTIIKCTHIWTEKALMLQRKQYSLS